MVPPSNQDDFPLFVDDALCASLEGTRGYACFNRVWRDGRWALEQTAVRQREPIGMDYFVLMMSRMTGGLSDTEYAEAIQKMEQANLVTEHLRYSGMFRGDRRI